MSLIALEKMFNFPLPTHLCPKVYRGSERDVSVDKIRHEHRGQNAYHHGRVNTYSKQIHIHLIFVYGLCSAFPRTLYSTQVKCQIHAIISVLGVGQ